MFICGGAAIPTFVADRPFVRIGIRDERKILGVGETTPWPAVSPEVVAAMALAIGQMLPEIGYVDLDELPPLDAIKRALAPVEGILQGAKAARFALETALLDAIGQRRDVSITECLLASPGHPEVPCNALLDAAKDDLSARAMELQAQGFGAIKVKLRARDEAGFVRELAALREMRKVWPGELRLDPNGAWTVAEAREKLEKLADVSPRYVEQPVPAEQLVDLGMTAVPWAADESLLLQGMPERLVESGACAAFILKPALLGGFSTAFALAKLAQSAGIAAITTHALDGPVGIAAAVEFARAVPGAPPACGLDAHPGLSAYPALSLPHHAQAGIVTRAARSGLGFTEEERKRWLGMA